MTDAVPRSGGGKRNEQRRPDADESAAALVFDDPLTRPSGDDTDEGWGDRPTTGSAAADLARFLNEKPPHHL